jgi:hypothetical protein
LSEELSEYRKDVSGCLDKCVDTEALSFWKNELKKAESNGKQGDVDFCREEIKRELEEPDNLVLDQDFLISNADGEKDMQDKLRERSKTDQKLKYLLEVKSELDSTVIPLVKLNLKVVLERKNRKRSFTTISEIFNKGLGENSEDYEKDNYKDISKGKKINRELWEVVRHNPGTDRKEMYRLYAFKAEKGDVIYFDDTKKVKAQGGEFVVIGGGFKESHKSHINGRGQQDEDIDGCVKIIRDLFPNEGPNKEITAAQLFGKLLKMKSSTPYKFQSKNKQLDSMREINKNHSKREVIKINGS